MNQQSRLQVRNVAGFPVSTLTGNIVVGALSFMRLRTGVVLNGAGTCNGPCSVRQVDP